MVRGLLKFQEYFKGFTGSYVIIGGTACDIVTDAAGLKPRATKDIDIILVAEALTGEFVAEFWKFIEAGGYEIRERGEAEHRYYRFTKPVADDFPYQIELFSRNPDLLDLKEGTHLTPIPVSGVKPSLSAILLDETCYRYTIEHTSDHNGLLIAKIEALVCLKIKAFLDLSERKENGEEVSSKEIRKHRNDVFRLVALLSPDSIFELPPALKEDFYLFTDLVKQELPDTSIYQDMGMGPIDGQKIFNQMLANFNL